MARVNRVRLNRSLEDGFYPSFIPRFGGPVYPAQPTSSRLSPPVTSTSPWKRRAGGRRRHFTRAPYGKCSAARFPGQRLSRAPVLDRCADKWPFPLSRPPSTIISYIRARPKSSSSLLSSLPLTAAAVNTRSAQSICTGHGATRSQTRVLTRKMFPKRLFPRTYSVRHATTTTATTMQSTTRAHTGRSRALPATIRGHVSKTTSNDACIPIIQNIRKITCHHT